VTRDEFKQGLGWSSAMLDSRGAVQFDSALNVAGGRLSSVAEDVMTDVARSLAAAGARLRACVASGSPVAAQLLSQFERGEMDPEILHPSVRDDRLVELDTSAGGPPQISPIEQAVRELLA